MLCGLTKEQQHENSTFTYEKENIFFFAIANEKYDALERFKKNKKVETEQVLPDIKGCA